ncbi:MAG: site-specific DNA-methyltransferase, partial [Selenomonadaceae bacterium]|nr:site-specific DNA-methyltransferase [Selenomonadaceae bacterium]
VKCIYIDPPFNTGSDSFGYNDHFNHSTWLTFMKNRLALAKDLLKPDGSIWISIDDDEGHYLKVLADEIFDRKNFVATVIWEKKYSPQNDATWLSDSHDFILVYAKDKTIWRPNLLPRTEEMNARYKNPDNDPRGVWKADNALRKDVQQSGLFTITTPSGRKCNPQQERAGDFLKKNFWKWLPIIEFGLVQTVTMSLRLNASYRKFSKALFVKQFGNVTRSATTKTASANF